MAPRPMTSSQPGLRPRTPRRPWPNSRRGPTRSPPRAPRDPSWPCLRPPTHQRWRQFPRHRTPRLSRRRTNCMHNLSRWSRTTSRPYSASSRTMRRRYKRQSIHDHATGTARCTTPIGPHASNNTRRITKPASAGTNSIRSGMHRWWHSSTRLKWPTLMPISKGTKGVPMHDVGNATTIHAHPRRPAMHHWFLTLPLLLLPVAASAATFVVSTSGSDSASCTADAPCRTIRHGLDRLGSGDTLRIQGGTYNENDLRPPSGSTVEGAAAAAVVIRPTGGTAAGFELGAGVNGVIIRYIKIDGSGGGISYGIRVFGTDNVIENVEVANVQNQGIALFCPDGNHTGCGGGRNRVVDVYSHGAGSAGCHGTTAKDGYCHGIYIYSNDNVIEGGEFAQNNGWGIQSYGSNTRIDGAVVCHNNENREVTLPGYRAFPDACDQLVYWDGSSGKQVAGTPRSVRTTGAASLPPPPPAPRNLRVLSLP